MSQSQVADEQDVQYERQGDLAIIRINRPHVGNSVGPSTMMRLCQALDRAMGDDSRAIVLTHTGRHFISGADFAFLEDIANGQSTLDVHKDIYEYFLGASKRLHLCPKPTIAAISGAAITVGCELAIACDFRIVTPSARFQESWIRLGLIAPLGGLKVLPGLVGMGLAKDMMLRARAVGGEEALLVGLAHECVGEDQLLSSALKLAQELASTPIFAYRAAKEGLRRGQEVGLGEVWDHGVLAQSVLLGSPDFQLRLREASAALKSKR
ncbi:enoyl-CoA hydratase/isomerase family protein [Pseudomonas sp. NFX224]|uniref:enoyl-CoA hydratase/isomerase family protein n=1 Tax=Pseudomonas sp. NFX224 TaxID=3402862 RepID=UPI003AFA464F